MWRQLEIPAGQNPVAHAVARAIVAGFNKHYRLFRESSSAAKERFEKADWLGVQQAMKERVGFYDERVNECVDRLRQSVRADGLDHTVWQQAKLLYIGLLVNHKQPELAETFFNSVSCRILDRTYFNNDFIFWRPAVSTDYIEANPPTYRSYYLRDDGLHGTFRRIFLEFDWHRPFIDLDRDVGFVLEVIRRNVAGQWDRPEPNFQIKVLSTPFYRNKGAYVVGKAINGHNEHPFAIAVLHDEQRGLFLDTILFDVWRIQLLFSLNRAYFMAGMDVPSGCVDFLRGIMPTKSPAELYTILGLQKHGKTMFYRELLYHLHHSQDQFDVAPGIRGMVMLVFTLPSYPYVFKVIRDEIAPPKDVTPQIVKQKYLLVKQHDRVGRMADTLEFSNVALPRSRFSEALLDELRRSAPSVIEQDGDKLVIKHLYIERRMVPLNIYLDTGNEDQIEHAVREYGNAIRELAHANIFPGDMLWKNFGVTRLGRVVFYDYDEIEYLTDCNFRHIPPAPYPEYEMSGEPWYSVAKNDIFPEEFESFLLGSATVRKYFMKYHADLLRPEFWKSAQEKIRAGQVEDFFPYPESLRFCRVFRDRLAQRAEPTLVAREVTT
jgi:isocitrate dehydrogenase kinase/phosphatase